MENSREISKDVINLLSMSITGIVGIIGGFISGKNGRPAKQAFRRTRKIMYGPPKTGPQMKGKNLEVLMFQWDWNRIIRDV